MICSKCGKSNEDNFRFCQYCGTPTGQNVSSVMKSAVQQAAPDIPKSTVSTPAPSLLDDWILDDVQKDADARDIGLSIPDSMFDNNNQRQAVDDLNDDPHVTTKNGLISVPQPLPDSALQQLGDLPRICDECGEIVPEGHKFCGNCGKKYEPVSERELADAAREYENNTRRVVSRVNFLEQNVPQQATANMLMFSLFHINDDGSRGDDIPIIEGDNIIGRSSSPALNGDRFISPKHVRITCHGNTATIEDCGSLNGTFRKLNNESITLNDGDTFRIGEELLCYAHGKSTQPILAPRTGDDTKLLGGPESVGWGYISSILGPYSEGDVYRLYSSTVTLGRTSADILFPRDGFVSSRHASLRESSEGAILTDLNSSNGTFIKLKKPITVTDTICILIGNQLLCLAPIRQW